MSISLDLAAKPFIQSFPGVARRAGIFLLCIDQSGLVNRIALIAISWIDKRCDNRDYSSSEPMGTRDVEVWQGAPKQAFGG